jgi:putative ABC transport system permease protein
MFLNYLKIAGRNLWKRKLASGITVFGLVMAIACSGLIGLWVLDELSFDRFIPNADRVFRLETTTTSPDGSQLILPAAGWPVGKALQTDFPEVERLTYLKGWSPQLKHKGSYVKEQALMADEHFLAVLGYELAQGNPATALSQPFSVILSPEAEEKYFGKGRGMGQILMVNDTLPHRVTGIFKPIPRNGHLQFSMVRSLASLHTLFPQDMAYEYASGWFDSNVANYVLLKKGVDARAFGTKIRTLVSQRGRAAVKQTGMNSTLQLRPVADVYLHSAMPTINEPVGNSDAVYLFVAIGLFILLIASLNAINLTTASATDRAKEIGIKKALGVRKAQLIGQFLTETTVVCLTAAVLGIMLIVVLLPAFNQFTGKLFSASALVSPVGLISLTIFLALLIPLTGLYPAWVLTRFQPIAVLKGRFTHSAQGTLLRKGLVVAQFSVSIGLIACVVVAWQQVHFMQQQPLGFDQQKVVLVNLQAVQHQSRTELAKSLRDQLIKHSQIPWASASYAVPGEDGWNGQFAYGEGQAAGKGILVEHIPVDQVYARTLRLTVLAGRDFTPGSKADENGSFLVNEMAVKAFGWGNPQQAIGKRIGVSGVNGRVVGVLKNYHQHGLQHNIRPVVLNVMPIANVVAFRYAGTDPAPALHYLQSVWERLFPGYELTYSFLNATFQQQYVKEQKLIQLISIATCLAILISCLGLFGLATFMAVQRTKEIGIRKVLGASVSSIVTLLSKDFLKLVLIAIVIASPLAWYAMNRWLQGFAYRVDIAWWVFVLAGSLAVGIALLTVSFQSIRTALVNPVKSLRSD